MGGAGVAVLAPPSHPGCAKQVCLPLTTPPSYCSTWQGAGSTAGEATLLWGGGAQARPGWLDAPPGCAPPHSSSRSFLFFKLMLLWVLSCLYENKNNPKASIHTQPLPEALTALGATPTTTDRQETTGAAVCPQGVQGSPHPTQGPVPAQGTVRLPTP